MGKVGSILPSAILHMEISLEQVIFETDTQFSYFSTIEDNLIMISLKCIIISITLQKKKICVNKYLITLNARLFNKKYINKIFMSKICEIEIDHQVKKHIQQIRMLNDKISLSMLKQCQKDISTLQKRISQRIIRDKTTQEECRKQIAKWLTGQKIKIKFLNDYSESSTDQYLMEILYILVLGVYATFEKKIPRTTQLICLWINLHTQKTILQVKTGEGKTMIVAMTALYYALRGKKVDVITSSEALATTETTKTSSVRKYYTLFGVSLDENCSIKTTFQQAAKVYKAQIIYGTSFNFQADFLRKVFAGHKQFLEERQFDDNHVVILDEVDSLLIDRMKDSTRLSSQKPLYEKIRMVFVLIYEVKTKLMRAKQTYSGLLKITIMGKQIEYLNIKNNLEQNNSSNIVEAQVEQIEKIVRHALDNEMEHLIPQYLRSSDGYINNMLRTWIRNSFQAQKYEKDVHYMITKQRKVVPIDISTGTYQKNTKWSDGIHQFVELSHGIQLSFDSLVTNYQSNLIFFQRYKKYMYGMTGTIARSTQNKKSIYEQSLELLYGVKIYKIPTFKKRLLKTEQPRLMISQQEWLEVIIKDSKEKSSHRMVLLIFQTIKKAKQFINAFRLQSPNNSQYSIVELHDHDIYHDVMSLKMDKQKTIIVSTNLGGRGTDYQIHNQNILQNGGLFVMMTYFAENWRIQEQAFGRAGRNGQKGSGAFYINLGKYLQLPSSIYQKAQDCKKYIQQMDSLRQQNQQRKFQRVQDSRRFQETKKKLLDQFISHYVNPKLRKIKQFRQEKKWIQMYQQEMELSLVEQQWGLYLKKQLRQDTKSYQNVKFQDFVTIYEKNRKNHDVNPGILTFYASNILNVQPNKSQSNRSYQLFETANKKNKDWISKYYLTYLKLKIKETFYDKEEGGISQSFCRQICKDLNEIAQLMYIDLAITSAINSHFDSPQDKTQSKKKKDKSYQQIIKQTETFFISQIGKLLSLAQTLQKIVIDEKRKNIVYQCHCSTPNIIISRLSVQGFNKVFTLNIKQKTSGWKKFWTVVGCLAIGAVVGLVAFVALPALVTAMSTTSAFISLFGQGVILSTGVAGGIGAVLGGIGTILSLESFYPSNYKSVEKNNISAQSKNLIQITGDAQKTLAKQAQKKIITIYEKLNKKKQCLDDELHLKLEMIEQVKKMKTSNLKTQKIKKLAVDRYSLSIKKKNVMSMSNLQVNKIIHQQQNINQEIQNFASGIVQQHGYDKKIITTYNQNVQKLNTISQNVSKDFKTSVKQIESTYQLQYKKQIKRIDAMGSSTNRQIQKKNRQINDFNIKSKSDSQKIHKAVQKFQNEIKLSLQYGKSMNMDGLIKEIKLKPVQIKLKTFNKIAKQVNQYNQLNKQKKQIQKYYNQKNIYSTIIEANPQEIKTSVILQVKQGLQEAFLDKQKKDTIKKYEDANLQLDREAERKQEQILGGAIERSESMMKNQLNSPITNPQQINQFVHYSIVVKNLCIDQKINVQIATQDIDNFKQLFSTQTNKEQQCVILLKGAIYLKGFHNELCKVYEENDLTKELQNLIGKKCKFIKGNSQTIGWSIIKDVSEFIQCVLNDDQTKLKDFRINDSSIETFNIDQMRKVYTESILMEKNKEVLQKQHPQILEQRIKKGNGSLPLTYFPFQLKENSEKFIKIQEKILDSISESLLKRTEDFEKFSESINVAKDKLIMEQKQAINQSYTDYQVYLQQQIKLRRR